MPMLTAVLLCFSCRANPLEAALADRSPDPYGKGPEPNVHRALVAARAALGKDWSCSDKYRLSIASA